MIEIVKDAATAEALRAAGHSPAPYVGQRWEDRSVTWLPKGHKHVLTIKTLGRIVDSGWQAYVVRRQVDGNGAIVEGGGGEGPMWVSRLLDQCVPLPDLHVLDITEGEHGHRRYAIECPEITDACRAWWENACPPGCPVAATNDDNGWEDCEWDDDSTPEAHGVRHRWFSTSWWAATREACIFALHDHVPDVACDLAGPDGKQLEPGRYPVKCCTREDGLELEISVTA